MHDHLCPSEDVLVETMVRKDAAGSVAPIVGLIMGSKSDWNTMRDVADTLNRLGISNEPRVISAHRSPDRMFRYAGEAEDRGLSLIIAGAGGAAHLPGMTASKTILPVIGVPVNITPLRGLDALLSIMQMPAEVSVATMNVGPTGAVRAALFAATILALRNPQLYPRLRDERGDLLPDVQTPNGDAARAAQRQVLILAGSEADREVMRHSEEYLAKFDCRYNIRIMDPAAPVEQLLPVVREAEDRGTGAFIATSGHGMELARKVARVTLLPVLAVPTVHDSINCLDTFLKPFLDMPSGVATFAVNRPGAVNAALFAANILSGAGSEVRRRLKKMQTEQRSRVEAVDAELQGLLAK